MQPMTFVQQYTGLTPAQIKAQIVMRATPDGVFSFPTWNVTGLAPPTQAQIEAALAQASVIELASALTVAAAAVCDGIDASIVPDTIHRTAYLNAASMVGPSATVPATDPLKTTFANMAAQAGQEPQAFATLAVAIVNASWVLSTTKSALQSAATGASTVSQLQTAQSTFNSSISSLVSTINTAGIALPAPAPVAVPGLS